METLRAQAVENSLYGAAYAGKYDLKRDSWLEILGSFRVTT